MSAQTRLFILLINCGLEGFEQIHRLDQRLLAPRHNAIGRGRDPVSSSSRQVALMIVVYFSQRELLRSMRAMVSGERRKTGGVLQAQVGLTLSCEGISPLLRGGHAGLAAIRLTVARQRRIFTGLPQSIPAPRQRSPMSCFALFLSKHRREDVDGVILPCGRGSIKEESCSDRNLNLPDQGRLTEHTYDECCLPLSSYHWYGDAGNRAR